MVALSTYKSLHVLILFLDVLTCFLRPVAILLQRTVPRLGKVLAVRSQRPGLLGSSAAPAAPAGSGSPFSAHPGHQHRRLPPGAAEHHGQVQIRVVGNYTKLKKKTQNKQV